MKTGSKEPLLVSVMRSFKIDVKKQNLESHGTSLKKA